MRRVADWAFKCNLQHWLDIDALPQELIDLKPMMPVGGGAVYACANKTAECGNYGVSYRPPKVVQVNQ